MRARYYSPDLMRFMNEDIVTGDISNSNSLNRYSYVEGNPVSMVDPFGLCANRAQGNSQNVLVVNGWLRLYSDIPSSGYGRAVAIPEETDRNKWAMRESLSSINKYALLSVGATNEVIVGEEGEMFDTMVLLLNSVERVLLEA